MKLKKYKIFGHDYLRKDEVVQCLADIIDESIRQHVATGDRQHAYNAGVCITLKEFFENL